MTLVALLALSPRLAGAEVASSRAQADLNGDGRPEAVVLSRGAEDRFSLSVDGRDLAVDARGPALSSAEAELRAVDLGRGRRAALFRSPLEGEGLAFEAILSVRRGQLELAWSGVTGLRGDRGTRWGQRVIVEDLTGDGREDILQASVAEEVPLCGVSQPELFPRALDPESGRLRPVILNRLRHLSTVPHPVDATWTNPGALRTPPSLSVASFGVASTILGDRDAVEGLAAPRAIADGDRRTSWLEGRPGPGTGEFLSARLLPGPYEVRALALTLAPAAAEGEEEAQPLGRLRTLTVLLDGPTGPRRYLVTVPQDPIERPGEPVWVLLPEPARATCLSLVLGDVFGGEAPATGIAEVEVYTDLDFEGGDERLLAALREGTADVEVVLRALGERAIELLAERWADLDQATRRRALRVLASLDSPAAAPLLVEAAFGEDPRAAEDGRRGLVELGDSGLEALAAALEGQDGDRRRRVIELVGELGSEAAAELLWRRLVGEPGPAAEDLVPLQQALRRALADADGEGRAAVLEQAERVEGRPRQALLAALSPPTEEEQPEFARLVAETWRTASSFEDRYRLLSLAGGAPAEELFQLASGALRDETDRYLRAHAAEVLGQLAQGVPAAVTALAEAASDAWTGVRLAVARALRRADASAARGALAQLLEDPWPVVRAAAAESLVQTDPDGALEQLAAALGDRSPLVQGNAARLLGASGSERAFAPLRALAADEDSRSEARAAAAGGLGVLCSAQAQDALLELLRQGIRERRRVGRVRTAAAAATALTNYRSAVVGEVLAQAAREGTAPLRVAAIEALGRGGHPGARELLESFAEDPLPPLRAAAAAALRDLAQREDRPAPEGCPR